MTEAESGAEEDTTGAAADGSLLAASSEAEEDEWFCCAASELKMSRSPSSVPQAPTGLSLGKFSASSSAASAIATTEAAPKEGEALLLLLLFTSFKGGAEERDCSLVFGASTAVVDGDGTEGFSCGEREEAAADVGGCFAATAAATPSPRFSSEFAREDDAMEVGCEGICVCGCEDASAADAAEAFCCAEDWLAAAAGASF